MSLALLQPLENKICYDVYGLKVQSDILLEELKIYELLPGEEPDVYIECTLMPQNIKDKINENKLCFKKDESCFKIENVAIYRVLYGKNIYVESLGGELNEIKCFILGTSFGMLMFQRNLVAIHGGAIYLNGHAIIITGESGAGKSTLTSKFGLDGYKFLSDDVCAVELSKKKAPYVCSAYPQQKLCVDAVDKFSLNKDDYVLLDEGRQKYAIPAKHRFILGKEKLSYLFELSVKGGIDEVIIEEVKGISKLEYVIKNIYRIEIIRFIGLDGNYMKNVMAIASGIKVFKIIRPEGKFSVGQQMEKIIDIVEKE